MSHQVSTALGALLAAMVLAIMAISAVTSGVAPLGRGLGITFDRRINPILFWGYVLLFGGLAVLMAGFGIVQLARAILG